MALEMAGLASGAIAALGRLSKTKALQHDGSLPEHLSLSKGSSRRPKISAPDALAPGVKSPPDLRTIATLLLDATTAFRYVLQEHTYTPESSIFFVTLEAEFTKLTSVYDHVMRTLWSEESGTAGEDFQHELKKQESRAVEIKDRILDITKHGLKKKEKKEKGMKMRILDFARPKRGGRFSNHKNRKVQAMGSKLDVMSGSLGVIANLDRQVKTVTRTEVKVIKTSTLLRNSTLKRSNSFESTSDLLDTDSQNVNLATLGVSSFLGRLSRPQVIEGPQFKQLQNSSSGQAHAIHLEYRRARAPGTCNWLLETEEYRNWHSSPTASNLWIHGAPGIGKSTLMSKIVDELESSLVKTGKPSFAFFYATSASVLNREDLVTSVLQQLSLQIPDDEKSERGLRPSSEQVPYSSKMVIDARAGSKPDLRMIPNGSRILLDTWGGCGTGVIDDILRDLQYCDCSLLVFSRALPPPSFKDSLHITLERNKGDISHLLGNFIGTNRSLEHWWDIHRQSSATSLTEHLAAVSEGRFFRGALQAARLLTQRNQCEMNILSDTISDQNGLLDWAIRDLLHHQTPRLASLAQRTIKWLCHIKQPLEVLGLCQALAIAESLEVKKDNAKFMPREENVFTPEIISSCCKGLVWIDPGSKKLVLSDADIEVRALEVWSGHSRDMERQRLGAACANYLLLDDFGKGLCNTLPALQSRLQLWPFMSFASRHWLRHLIPWIESRSDTRDISNEIHQLKHSGGLLSDSHIIVSIRQLFTSREHLLAAAQALFWDVDEHYESFQRFQSHHDELQKFSTLQLASILGLDDIVRWRLKVPVHRLPVDRTPTQILSLSYVDYLYRKLAYALYGDKIEMDLPLSQSFEGINDLQSRLRELKEFVGEDTIFNLLLADEQLLSSHTPSLLQAAILTSNAGMVIELLRSLDRRGEKWDESNVEQWLGAFLAVCQTGSEKILLELFQRARNSFTLLANVARRDLSTTVAGQGHNKHDSHQLSPDTETEPEPPGTDSPLQVACRYGHMGVVRLLIRHGAYQDSTATGSPLMEAIRSDHKDREDMVARLLSAGVVTDTHEDKTPLQVACELGRTRIVDMLLRHGASSDIVVRRSTVPLLTIAVQMRQDDLLVTLLQGGIKSEAYQNKMPLQWACEMGQIDAVSTLLRYGASPDLTVDGLGHSPLAIAVERGQEELVMMLLYAGAKSTAGKTKTPLQAALDKDDRRIIRLLLARTSNVGSVKHLADGKDEEIRELFDRFDYR